MLKLTIPSVELFDEKKQEFIQTKAVNLELEHSLVSLSKWESKWNKPFLSDSHKTDEETIDYIRCMTITQNVDPNVYTYIPSHIISEIGEYINKPMTATWFKESRDAGPSKKTVITSERIYYWMIAHNIPMECQKWHLNRLLTLIRVCNIESSPPKKRSQKEMLAERKALNNARKLQYNTKG